LRPPLPSPSGVPESFNWAKGYVNKLGLVHLADSCRLAGVQWPASKVKPNITKTTRGDMTYEIPSKFALIKYVLGCAWDVGCCMKPAKTIGD